MLSPNTIRGGTHACYVFDADEEHRVVLNTLLRRALKRNERVLYVVDSRGVTDLLDHLRRGGPVLEPYVASGQLLVRTTDETYLSGGRFNSEKMMSLLRQERDSALAAGYRGLCVMAEMAWSLRGAPGSESLADYEEQVDELFHDGTLTGICQYDRRLFAPGALSGLARAHRIHIAASAAKVDIPSRAEGNATASRQRRGPKPLKGPSSEYLARQEEIVAAAAEVFRTKGYAAATLEDVAETLDMRRPALYYYIRSKNQLLWLIHQRVLNVIIRAMEDVRGIEDTAERLTTALRVHIDAIVKHRDLFKVFFEERVQLSNDDQKRLRSLEQRYVQAFTSTVAAAIDVGVLPASDPRQAALALIGLGTWIYKWFDPEQDDPEALVETCIRLVTAARPVAPSDVRRSRPRRGA
ncbi:MAG TPA: MEDS domain-containing protein [Acidimicrobiia bacterium]|nr:MEDS domain-containing protein [Acidimicrobiia bacterium]HMC37802.1 MEDS domain-containing protein [Actinomycetota bacterium]